ncbi:carbohydrate binding domain-containing protein [Streptomyces niveus]
MRKGFTAPSRGGNFLPARACSNYTKTKNWSAYNLHYAPDGGSWTTVPGVRMEAACTDWVKKTVTLGAAPGLKATFNNGAGVRDNNAGKNYDLGGGDITVKDGVVAHSDPCADTGPDPDPGGGSTADVYYATANVGWTTTNLHYQPDGGAWTQVPGVGMEPPAPAGCQDRGSRSRHRDAGHVQQRQRRVGQQQRRELHRPGRAEHRQERHRHQGRRRPPCAAEPPDTRAPTVPAKVTAKADGVAVVLTWEPSQDDRGVTKYQVTRTGGAKGTVRPARAPRARPGCDR